MRMGTVRWKPLAANTVLAGISPTADPENLTESDFYALDPARVTANGRLAVTRLLDHTLWVENSPLKVLG